MHSSLGNNDNSYCDSVTVSLLYSRILNNLLSNQLQLSLLSLLTFSIVHSHHTVFLSNNSSSYVSCLINLSIWGLQHNHLFLYLSKLLCNYPTILMDRAEEVLMIMKFNSLHLLMKKINLECQIGRSLSCISGIRVWNFRPLEVSWSGIMSLYLFYFS